MTTQIRVFEPALCCNTGVCGPELDQDLVRFTADLDYLKAEGVDISRHNLANDPTAFATNPVVVNFLQMVGSAGLPLVLVNDVTVATGRYPSRSEFLRFAGQPEHADLGLTAASGCCSDDVAPTASGCCGSTPETTPAQAGGCC